MKRHALRSDKHQMGGNVLGVSETTKRKEREKGGSRLKNIARVVLGEHQTPKGGQIVSKLMRVAPRFGTMPFRFLVKKILGKTSF